VFDLARDELFQHVIRCDVIGANPDHQAEWFSDTMQYMADRWHELSPKQLTELRTLGERFAQPARTSVTTESENGDATEEAEEQAAGDEESLDAVSA
jgi:hypothetical protein